MTTRQLVRTALFAALTAVGAFLKIPLGPSAITLQFFFTAMAGCLLGSGCGALSQLIYVLLGLLGLPIFTAGGGFSYVLHPTFGFLLGLIPAAWVIGRLARSTCSFWRIALAALVGLAVLYAVGLPYMAMILNGYMGKGMDLSAILYIKADVEGADFETLIGMQKTMENCKPKLNFSAYHIVARGG